ncbi:MAG: ankyrin repeat domain-containing protein [Elusimicrobia bacterium]|nr:ankyrin repeat domain-containing protein [Elusimicrobiota bacterium]
MLFEAIQAGDLDRVKALLREDPALARARDANGTSALMMAAYAEAPAIARAIQKAGAPVNIFEATALGRQNLVRDLLAITPDLLRATSHDGWTLLHLAAFFGHVDLVRFLVGRGADLRAISRNQMANQPLHSAVAGRRLAVAELLLRAGANVNAPAQTVTPLHLAAHAGHGPLVELLLAFGADTKARDAHGHNAAALAAEQSHTAIADFIRRY